jgi:hypothetical protein
MALGIRGTKSESRRRGSGEEIIKIINKIVV